MDNQARRNKGKLDAIANQRIKKKVDFELETFFPEKVNTSEVLKFYALKKRFASVLIREVLGEETKDDQEKIIKQLKQKHKPEKYNAKGGIDEKIQGAWEEMYSVCRLHNIEPKTLTVYEFYKQVEIIAKSNSNGKSNKGK